MKDVGNYADLFRDPKMKSISLLDQFWQTVLKGMTQNKKHNSRLYGKIDKILPLLSTLIGLIRGGKLRERKTY